MSYVDMYHELRGQLPALSIFLAQKFIQRAWKDIRRARSWSFLVKEGVLQAPASISTGTVSATQFSSTVTPNAAAITALSAAGANPLLSKRQFSLAAGSPIYNISAYDGAVITLDRDYQEATVAGSAYRVHRAYYEPPAADFIRFIVVRDVQDSRIIKLGMTKEELDKRDPQRSSTGIPYHLATHAADSSGSPLYELWPHPTSQRSYMALYHARGADLAADADTLPSLIPESLVLDKAMIYAYEWAAVNSGRVQELKGINWLALKQDRAASYTVSMRDLAREDDEIFLQSIVVKECLGDLPYPFDANFLQSHDFSYY